MKKKDKLDTESREYWQFVRETAQEVKSWPDWMKDGLGASSAVLLSTASGNKKSGTKG